MFVRSLSLLTVSGASCLSCIDLLILLFVPSSLSLPSVQQSSYYGLAGMMPKKYTQAVMVGESIAGLVVSINRIFTKAATDSLRLGAITFFVMSLLYILFCVLCQLFLRMSPFVKYHVSQCRQDRSPPAASNQVPSWLETARLGSLTWNVCLWEHGSFSFL